MGKELRPLCSTRASASGHVNQDRQMRMEKRSQVCGWSPVDPAYHIKSIRVAQGWGQEEGCPSLICCQGLQPSGVEGSAWRKGVNRASPGTPTL